MTACNVDGCTNAVRSLGYCKRHYDAQRREANREKLSAQQADWYQRNRERLVLKQRAYRLAQREKLEAVRENVRCTSEVVWHAIGPS